MAFPPHEALLAVAVSADANTENAEAAHSNGRDATVACSSRTRPPTKMSTLGGRGWGEGCGLVRGGRMIGTRRGGMQFYTKWLEN